MEGGWRHFSLKDENYREVGVKLSKDVLQQVEELATEVSDIWSLMEDVWGLMEENKVAPTFGGNKIITYLCNSNTMIEWYADSIYAIRFQILVLWERPYTHPYSREERWSGGKI